MANPTVSKAVEFDHAPAYPRGLFQVNAGIDRFHVLGTADCLMDFIQTRIGDADEGLSAEEAYALALVVDMARALYRSAGASA